MWNSLPEPWKICFEQAWEAYCNGSIPIGAVIVDKDHNIIFKGRNRISEKTAPPKQICFNKLAHAELNALLQLDLTEHPQVKTYSLYTTLEPCPLCFGAIVMSNIKNVYFAARDKVAGATSLKNDFIKEKNISIIGPEENLEFVQFALKTDFLLGKFRDPDRLLDIWKEDCPKGIETGRKLFKSALLKKAREDKKDVSEVFNYIINLLV